MSGSPGIARAKQRLLAWNPPQPLSTEQALALLAEYAELPVERFEWVGSSTEDGIFTWVYRDPDGDEWGVDEWGNVHPPW